MVFGGSALKWAARGRGQAIPGEATSEHCRPGAGGALLSRGGSSEQASGFPCCPLPHRWTGPAPPWVSVLESACRLTVNLVSEP